MSVMSDAPLFSGIVPALVTPLNVDNSVNTHIVQSLVDHHIASGIGGFYLSGSTGEGFAFSVEHRIAFAKAVLAAVTGRVPVMMHVGGCSEANAIILAKAGESMGVQAISSVAPGSYSWLDIAVTQEDLTMAGAAAYFRRLAASTALPFYVYWLNSGIQGSAREFLDAVHDIPNLAGVKYTAQNMFVLQQLRDISKTRGMCRLNLLSGMDECNLAAAVMGSDGAIGSTYNLMPKLFTRLWNAFVNKDLDTAMALTTQVNRVISEMIAVSRCNERGVNIISCIKAVYRARRGLDVGAAHPTTVTHKWTVEQEDQILLFLDSLDFVVE